ncbi:LacI family transcriptional regulator [Niabella sp. W65]|nr:LacI family transcriptional regulator [Niabella sp. W65]MCH7363470.1 LacI family transcriptional regulator [Niabella sp. W65]ULT39393.1 LacI family transcriptional regulator [Niabella sp. I65]
MGNITIRELAQQLGLSIATVSKALKDSYEISDATKKKIVSLANELNYTPNPYASSLRKQQSKTLAVVLPEVADSFFSLAINGIQEVALAKGYHVLFYLSHESFELEKKRSIIATVAAWTAY